MDATELNIAFRADRVQERRKPAQSLNRNSPAEVLVIVCVLDLLIVVVGWLSLVD